MGHVHAPWTTLQPMNLHLKVGTGSTPSTLVFRMVYTSVDAVEGVPILPLLVNRILFQTFVANLVATFVEYCDPKSLRQRCR